MPGSNPTQASLRRAALAVAASCALAAVAAAGAAAQSGGAIAPGATPPSSPPSAPAGSGEPPAASVRVLAARARPGKGFYFGVKPARFAITLAAKKPTDMRLDILAKGAGVLRSLYAYDVAPGVNQVVAWDGLTSAGAPPQGRLRFRIRGVNGEPIADSKKFRGKPAFAYYDHIFPVRGKHSWGDGLGAGRGHRGQDLPAACGTKLVAARGGTVEAASYQAGGAGNYVVIDGAGTDYDYVYMHMLAAPSVAVGQVVKTGQQIGQVGSTGHSTGCHLHFELWSAPGWYAGGAALSPTAALRAWDAYS